jgi:hypothetical protein
VFTGLLAGPACALQEQDAFIVGTAPYNLAPCYWNASAQPKPYKIGTGPIEAAPDTVIVQLPQSSFGEPTQYPLGKSPLLTSPLIPWELNQVIPLELDLPVPLPQQPARQQPTPGRTSPDQELTAPLPSVQNRTQPNPQALVQQPPPSPVLESAQELTPSEPNVFEVDTLDTEPYVGDVTGAIKETPLTIPN